MSMKKRYKFLCLPALAGMALLCFSCAKQETEPAPAGEAGAAEVPGRMAVRTISAGIVEETGQPAASPATRTDVSVAGKVVWSEGDEIAVFAEGKAYLFELTAGAGGENATFTCYDEDLGDKALDGVAVYPYQSDLTYNASTGAVQVYVPTEQSYTRSSAPMVGSVSASRYFFCNLGGIFQFTYNNVPPEAKSLKFTATTDLSGVFTLSSTADRLTAGKESTPLATENTKEIHVAIPVARPDGTVTVQVPVPAGNYSGFSIALCNASGEEITGMPGLPDTRKAPSATIKATVNKLSPIKAITLPEGVKVQWIWDNDGALGTFSGNVPAIDAAGNVYVQNSNDNKLFKIDRNGQKVWEFPLTGISGRNDSSPSLEDDGSVVYAFGGNTTAVLYAVNASAGTQKWKFTGWPTWGNNSTAKGRVAVGDGDFIYVPLEGGTNTLVSVRKSDGARVAYSSSAADGTTALSNGTCEVAISAEGAVVLQTLNGAYVMKQSLLDNPTQEHATNGKYVPFSYRDLWPATWGAFGWGTQGVVCGKKGPTTGKNVIVSCAQEKLDNSGTIVGSRFDVYCSSAEEALACNLYRQADVAYDNSDWHAYWRYQYGTHSLAGRPGTQDQGGIILGHNDLEVLLPLKANEVSTGKDDQSRPVGPAGIVAVWMDRYDTKPSSRSATTSWRFNLSSSAYADASTHNIESTPEISGSPAVDNNGWVHVGSRENYYIISTSSLSPYTITQLSKVNWADLLNASGALSKTVRSANSWTSVKIGDDGRIYFNLYCTYTDSTTGGAVLCLTYPGVTSPDPTSSWPQKGADPRNSCRQVSDASVWNVNTSNPISWD